MKAEDREELAARVLGVTVDHLRTCLKAPETHPKKNNERWPTAHAESCPAIASRPAPCTCSGGNYVRGRRGTRQLGEYDG